ncbi:hypothetical protein GCM10010435_91540 [Winogradskya consettensis]|uniref:HTH cro/C1-type domain-containing protein n=1 Tax=Winogradskya consettensis TaxID=113560 RepID=A0A919SYU0_9ACTN|nr:hypothetical protein Aco04nite_76620 [Actinoplanes consettensis]
MFGERVRARRRELGLTQEELAELARIDVKTVRMIETGRRTPRPATARMIADALRLDDEEARGQFLTGPAPGRPVPAQLPPDVYGFVGRTAQLRALDTITTVAGGRPVAVAISALSGAAGIGKTTLAVHWAHQARARFPDGQLHADLRGFDPDGSLRDPGDVLSGFLGALGVEFKEIPAGLDDRAALYRSMLADRKMLVLLDNARDAAQVRPLLPGAKDCMVLVTSRDDLAGLVARHGAHPLGLHLLSTDEAFQLLARRLGADRLAAAPAAVEEIITRCARLPLALTIAAALAATRPEVALEDLAAELRDTRLDTLAVGDPAGDVRAVFSWSYRTLTPGAARLFRLLGLHPGPEMTVESAASLIAEPVVRTRLLLAELATASLLSEPLPGRFTFHDLLRAYAADRAYREEEVTAREAATRRMMDHFLHTALAADRVFARHRNPIAAPAPAPGALVEEPPGRDEAMTWFLAEHEVLLAAIDQAARTGNDAHVWHLAWSMATYLHRRALFQDWVTTQQTAMAAAVRLGDRDRQVRTHTELAGGYFNVGRVDEALDHLREAITLYGALGDAMGQAGANLNLAIVLGVVDRHREALACNEQALIFYRQAGSGEHEAHALNAIGWCHVQLGDYPLALRFSEESVALHLELGDDDHSGLGAAWDTVGYAHHHLGNYDDALRCYAEALAAYRRAADPYNESEILTHIGDTHDAAGDRPKARDAWRRSLTILENLDHPDAATLRAKLAS